MKISKRTEIVALIAALLVLAVVLLAGPYYRNAIVNRGRGQLQQWRDQFDGARKLRVEGNPEEAEKHLLDALQLSKAMWPNSVQEIQTLVVLCGLYNDQERFVEALRLGKEALAASQTMYGADSIYIVPYLGCVAEACLGLEDANAAAEYAATEIAIRDQTPYEDKEHFREALRRLALAYQMQGKSDDALRIYERIIPMTRDAFDRETAELAKVLYAKAQTLSEQGEYEAAEPVFAEAVKVLELLPATWKRDGKEAVVEGYADVLRHLGRDQEARNVENRSGD